MDRMIEEDVISQAELRKGATFTTGTSAAIRLVRELYMQALARRLTDGALIEPGPLSFDRRVGVVCRKKDADTETRVGAVKLRWHSGGSGSNLGHGASWKLGLPVPLEDL
jgi:hypothetical protein